MYKRKTAGAQIRTEQVIRDLKEKFVKEEKKPWIEKNLKQVSERQMSNEILSEEERLKGVQRCV